MLSPPEPTISSEPLTATIAAKPASHRLAFLATSFALFVTIATSIVPSPLYQTYRELWGLPASSITAAFGAYCLAVLGTLLLVGSITDRFPRRQVMLVGLGLVSFSLLAFLAADSLGWLFVARVLSGIGTGCLASAATAALVELSGAGRARFAAVLSTVLFSIGAAFGPSLSTIALHLGLWPTHLPYLILLVLVAISISLLLCARWPERHDDGRAPLSWREWRPAAARVAPEVRHPFLIAACMLALAWAVGAVFNSLGPTLFTRTLGIQNPGLAGAMVVLFQLVAGITPLFSQHLPDRRVLATCPVLLALGLGACLLAIDQVSVPAFVVAVICTAAACGSVMAAGIASLSGQCPVDRRGETLSAFYVVGYLSSAVPLFAIGVAVDHIGMFTTLAAVTMLACLAVPGVPLAQRSLLGRPRR